MDENEIQDRAKELIDLKRTIKELLIKEKELKVWLLPSIKEHGAVTLDFGRVYYGSSKGAETFSRKSVLQYLRDSYGDALADQVDEDCTKQGEARETLYIKLNDL
ncbi:MAG: hypothetical protein RNU03_01310 [Candidatus Sedimenticola sp. (ex Thyasira tokunagai)]